MALKSLFLGVIIKKLHLIILPFVNFVNYDFILTGFVSFDYLIVNQFTYCNFDFSDHNFVFLSHNCDKMS